MNPDEQPANFNFLETFAYLFMSNDQGMSNAMNGDEISFYKNRSTITEGPDMLLFPYNIYFVFNTILIKRFEKKCV